MRKSWLNFILSISLGLSLISGWLIITPVTALAVSCCALCPGTVSQCCWGDPGTICFARDGVGCTSTLNGNTVERFCSKHRPPIGE